MAGPAPFGIGDPGQPARRAACALQQAALPGRFVAAQQPEQHLAGIEDDAAASVARVAEGPVGVLYREQPMQDALRALGIRRVAVARQAQEGARDIARGLRVRGAPAAAYRIAVADAAVGARVLRPAEPGFRLEQMALARRDRRRPPQVAQRNAGERCERLQQRWLFRPSIGRPAPGAANAAAMPARRRSGLGRPPVDRVRYRRMDDHRSPTAVVGARVEPAAGAVNTGGGRVAATARSSRTLADPMSGRASASCRARPSARRGGREDCLPRQRGTSA